jgi:hypothetical protein
MENVEGRGGKDAVCLFCLLVLISEERNARRCSDFLHIP